MRNSETSRTANEAMRRQKEAAETAEASVRRWNEQFPIGTHVHFHPVIGQPGFRATRTTAAAWVLSGHTAVVSLHGVPGCVALEACEPEPETADQAEAAGRAAHEAAVNAKPVNRYLVGMSGAPPEFHVMRPPLRMTPTEALELAAYLVAMAEPFAKGRKFAELLEEVRNS